MMRKAGGIAWLGAALCCAPASLYAERTFSPRMPLRAMLGRARFLAATGASGELKSAAVDFAPSESAGQPGAPMDHARGVVTGLKGFVTIGPLCPGHDRSGGPCPDKPYEATITIWRDGKEVGHARSDPQGRFMVELPAGTYKVVGESPRIYPRSDPQAATVIGGQTTFVEIKYDTGMR